MFGLFLCYNQTMTQEEALKILKSGANVFITGEPGSGKTYAINRYVAYLRSHCIECAITASTGIAATHIGGMTIHSWSGIGIKNKLDRADLRAITTNEYIRKRVEKAKVLIIDEISMLSPQTLDMVDAVCKSVKNNADPFGGLQVVLAGDFFQLPPVVKRSLDEYDQDALFESTNSKFAYDSSAWKSTEFMSCYITEQYRHDDKALVAVLSKIRRNSFNDEMLDHIRKRRIESFKAPALAPKLFSHNVDVDMVNNQMLEKIPGEPRLFQMTTKGHEALVTVMKNGCLSPESLNLKIGAAVMFTKNNPKGHYVNGTLGVVEEFSNETGLPIVKIRNGGKIEAGYADWTIEEDGKIKGRLTQVPLRLAWAITVHKSQGMSLDEAVIDLASVFEFGQGYVALSRVRRMAGIYLLGWNSLAFQVNPEVVIKDEEFRLQSKQAEKMFSGFSPATVKEMQKDFITHCGGTIEESFEAPKKQKKTSTQDETLKLLKEKKSLAQIAKMRELSEATVFSHVEDLFKKGKIKREGLAYLMKPSLSRALPKIHAAFESLKTNRLTPVFEMLKGKYSYDDLKLARMMIE